MVRNKCGSIDFKVREFLIVESGVTQDLGIKLPCVCRFCILPSCFLLILDMCPKSLDELVSAEYVHTLHLTEIPPRA